MKYKVIKLTSENREELSFKIKEMSDDIYYPLGNDFFKIDHGKDYFAFFERLGELHYWCVFDGDQLIGVAAGILKDIQNKKTWYLCDLKVKKEYRGKGIPRLIFRKAFMYNLKSKGVYRAYAISMDSNDETKQHKKIKKSTFGLLKKKESLRIYSLTKNEYLSVCHKFKKHRLVNTNGKKELILKSNKKRLNLFHVNKKKIDLSSKYIDPSENAIIMVSTYEGDEYDLILREASIKHKYTVSILTFRIKKSPMVFTDEI